ncbi:MAG: hypothetical protein R2759_11035 [Bacteroidales bacterium]
MWEKIYGFESDEEAFTAALAPDGGYLIGATSTHKSVAGDIWLLKLNAAGDSAGPNGMAEKNGTR